MDRDEEKHINFIYERLINRHGENPNLDYMIKLRKLIDSLSKQREFNRMELMSKMASKLKRPKTTSTKYNYLVITESYEKIIKTGEESPEELNELHSERREVFEEMFSEFDKVILYCSDSEKETKFQVLTVEK